MTQWAEPIRKVTALITRPGVHGAELLVFEHPVGELQIPAGTVDRGEPFADAAMREAWEETGALGLEMVNEVAALDVAYGDDHVAIVDDLVIEGRRFTRGWHSNLHGVDGDEAEIEPWTSGSRVRVPVGSVTCGEDRRVFHLRCAVEMPDDWWVVTPDGGGLTWRCCWVPLDDAVGIVVASNRPWAEAGRPHVDTSGDPPPTVRPSLPVELHDQVVHETFFAPPYGGFRTVAALDDQFEADECTRAHGLCVTEDGMVVVVQGADGRWELPGGGREPEETIVDTFAREVAEEACASVTAVAYAGALCIARLDERGTPSLRVDHHAQLWARVELDEWAPKFETVARRLLAPVELLAIGPFPFQAELLLERAVLIDPALDWTPQAGNEQQ
ncbi:MAG: NUDIX domain-containing protein [Acidimicrobiia bacterium]